MSAPAVFVRLEAGVEGRMSQTFGPFPFVQLTYQELRVGPDGESFACYLPDRGEWITRRENPAFSAKGVDGLGDSYVWYTDIVIHTDGSHV